MSECKNYKMKWAIIGAGPAGIAAVGKLLDAGINPNQITWIDPNFTVGDFGQKWSQVSSNTTVLLFLKFLNACRSFQFKDCPVDFEINHLPVVNACLLQQVADPLQWITNQLMQKVNCIRAKVEALTHYMGAQWQIKTTGNTLFATNVILAIGSDPIQLPLSGPPLIPIEIALDRHLLQAAYSKQDTIAVFGGSHTAIVTMYNLIELGVGQIINFYRSPLKYAVYLEDWILHDNTGLKHYSAAWARKYLEIQPLQNIERILVTDQSFESKLATCNKAIYAVGFERRKLPYIYPYENIEYNTSTGILAPGLFGLGIAFPQGKYDPLGNFEYRVGLWKFMDYLEYILPIWLSYDLTVGE